MDNSSQSQQSPQSDISPFIRKMTEFDIEPVMAIENEAYEFPWTLGIMSDCLKVGYHCYVYEVDGVVRAYLIYSTVLDEVHLLNICIDKSFQNNGYGHFFLNWLIDQAREAGSKTLYLEVRASNLAAIHLYEKMGFNELGIRANYYPAIKGKENAQLYAYEIVSEFPFS